jgi:hypothetical protein
MPFSTYDEHSLEEIISSLDDATGDTWQVIAAPPSSGARYDAISLSSDDTIDHVVEFASQAGGEYALLGFVTVPAGAGYSPVPAVDGLAYLQLGVLAAVLVKNGSIFVFRTTVLPSAGKYVNARVVGGLF